jgi:hypothetical protein
LRGIGADDLQQRLVPGALQHLDEIALDLLDQSEALEGPNK